MTGRLYILFTIFTLYILKVCCSTMISLFIPSFSLAIAKELEKPQGQCYQSMFFIYYLHHYFKLSMLGYCNKIMRNGLRLCQKIKLITGQTSLKKPMHKLACSPLSYMKPKRKSCKLSETLISLGRKLSYKTKHF